MTNRTLRNHQINGKNLWHAAEYLTTAIGAASEIYSGPGLPKNDDLAEAEKLMRKAQALLIKAGQANDPKAEQDFFTTEALADAGIEA